MAPKQVKKDNRISEQGYDIPDRHVPKEVPKQIKPSTAKKEPKMMKKEISEDNRTPKVKTPAQLPKKSVCVKKKPILKEDCEISSASKLRNFKDVVENLNAAQRACVVDMGFESFLEIRCPALLPDVCTHLVNNFDIEKCLIKFHGRELPLSSAIFSHVMGMTVGTLFCRSGGAKDDKYIRWEAYFKDNNMESVDGSGVLIDKLEKDLLQWGQPADDCFKVKFALFLMGTVLCPSGFTGIVSYAFLGIFRDPEKIKDLRLAELCFKFLKNGVAFYHQNKNRENQTLVKGCLLFLQLFYCHSIVLPGVPPLLSTTPALATITRSQLQFVKENVMNCSNTFNDEGIEVRDCATDIGSSSTVECNHEQEEDPKGSGSWDLKTTDLEESLCKFEKTIMDEMTSYREIILAKMESYNDIESNIKASLIKQVAAECFTRADKMIAEFKGDRGKNQCESAKASCDLNDEPKAMDVVESAKAENSDGSTPTKRRRQPSAAIRSPFLVYEGVKRKLVIPQPDS